MLVNIRPDDVGGELEVLLAHPLDPDIEQASMDILLPLMESEDQPFLSTDEQGWEDTIKWLDEQGMLEKDITAGDILVDLTKSETAEE